MTMQHSFRAAVRKTVFIVALVTGAVALPSFFAAGQAPVVAGSAPNTTSPASAVPQDSQRTIAVILVKNALLAVNQGNLTGNYTVLRDLASPGFREKNSAADLAAIFQ